MKNQETLKQLVNEKMITDEERRNLTPLVLSKRDLLTKHKQNFTTNDVYHYLSYRSLLNLEYLYYDIIYFDCWNTEDYIVRSHEISAVSTRGA